MIRAKTIRRTYGKPWSRVIEGVSVDRAFLRGLGKFLVEEVAKEADKALEMQRRRRTPRGQPEGLPTSGDFLKSFSYRIKGKSTLEIQSTWPWIEQLLEGRSRYRMWWLTRERGVKIVPMEGDNGETIFRWTPKTAADAWVHPGFKGHDFVSKAFKNVRRRMEEYTVDYIVRAIEAEGSSHPG